MKVTANIATYPPRKESLKKMLESIAGQFDEVRVCFNEYESKEIKEIGEWFTYTFATRFDFKWPEDNLTDNGKFHALDNLKQPEIYCTLDDDLIYPPDYRRRIEYYMEIYGGIISFHGRQLLGTGRNYYKGHRNFLCLGDVHNDEVIDVPGTGVMAFDTTYFHPKGLAYSEDKRMSDLVFALEAAKQGKQIAVINHKTGWIKPINNKETIYETETRNGIGRQNEIADEIYKLRYGNN